MYPKILVITFCSQGEIREYDCSKAGLSGCAIGTQNDQTVAWCTE